MVTADMGSRLARTRVDLHTGSLTLDSINGIGSLNLANLICTNNSSRTGECTLLLLTVSYNYYFVHSLGIGLQRHLHAIAGSKGSGLHTHKTKIQALCACGKCD